MLSYVLIFALIFNITQAGIVHGKHVIVNGSLEKVQLTNESIKEEPTRKVNPLPIVEVIHGKVNSVIHEIRGSIDDNIPPLLSKTVNKDELLAPTLLKPNTITVELTESDHGGPPGVETVLDEGLLTRASDLIENTSSSHATTSQSTPLSTSTSPSVVGLPEPPSLPPSQLADDFKPVPPVVSPGLNNGSKDDQHHDDIPSFSEWAKKQMAEVEKNKGENLTFGTVKARLKNYASPDCGAKVVASNPESVSAGAILSPSRDDYMLNACKDKIWFVVELCEAIQPQRIEIANFELFSSSPKELSISVIDRFPTREWSLVKSVTAKDERTVQSFPLPQLSQFAKYVKVELYSHYGSEHYCPISLFKAYGTSELEVLDNVDNGAEDDDEDDESIHSSVYNTFDEDEDAIDQGDRLQPTHIFTDSSNGNGATNTVINKNDELSTDTKSIDDTKVAGGGDLLGTAKAAVMSIVKKATDLVKGENNNGTRDVVHFNKNSVHQKYCVTPAYLIVCTNCTDDFYNRVYEHLSCKGQEMGTILSNSFVNHMLLHSPLCTEIGLHLGPVPPPTIITMMMPPQSIKVKITTQGDSNSEAVDYLRSFLYPEKMAALCNYLAITEKKVLLNTSQNVIYEKEIVKPELTPLPIPEEKQELITDGEVSGDTRESKTAELLPEKTIADIISPTKTLPIVNDEMSHEVNDSGEIENQQRPPSVVENTTLSTATLADISNTIATVAQVPAGTTITVPASPQSLTPLTPVNIEEKTDEVNNTEGIEIHVPSPQVHPTVPVMPSVQDEVVDQQTLASLFSELDEEGSTESAATKTTTSSQPTQKESVFVRLANRIKALEVNMSLSGQYLEELSRRYKKQVEELQRTLSNMVEERRLAAERENQQAAQISSLTMKMETLTLALSELRDDKVSMIGQHGVIIVVEVFVFLIVLAVCRWLGSAKSSNGFQNGVDHRVSTQKLQNARRHSVDNVDGPSAPKIRRPSEAACLPSGTTHKELLVDGVKRKTSREGARKRKRRRKERWEDEGIVILGANGEETNLINTNTAMSITSTTSRVPTTTTTTTKWQPLPPGIMVGSDHHHHGHNQDYAVHTALSARAKRTSHTQTSSQETLSSIQTLPHHQPNNHNNHSLTSSSSSTTATSTNTSSSKNKKTSSGGTIKKIVKRFF